jgi:hypothetical protein
VQPASDFDRIASNIAIWHGYDSGVKAELYSTCLGASGGTYFIDPIPLESEALSECGDNGLTEGNEGNEGLGQDYNLRFLRCLV